MTLDERIAAYEKEAAAIKSQGKPSAPTLPGSDLAGNLQKGFKAIGEAEKPVTPGSKEKQGLMNAPQRQMLKELDKNP